ncbi:hypothetical protein [Methanobrevibacter sp.]|uniref:hypothetical protein n=1 Tax=Methanobrevibacter sp. TaxID=66852 RepID=UPI00388E5378
MKDKISVYSAEIKPKLKKIKKYLSINLFYYFLIFGGLILIFILLSEIFYTNIGTDDKVIFTNLIIVTTSFIALIVNLVIRNKDNKNREKENYINLRFNEVNSAINELMLYLQITFTVYNQICNLNNSNNLNKCYYLSPRGFLVMQFTNLTSNFTLLNKLPITLRVELEYEFNKRTTNKLTRSYENELHNIKNFDSDINLIRNNIAYKRFIDEFKNNSDYEQNNYFFSVYYESNDIKTEEFYEHFKRIFDKLCSNSTRDLILKDMEDEYDEEILNKLD